MFDLHTVHLKSFCSFMCPLNVFQTYVANEGLGLYIGGDYSLHFKCYVTCTICQHVR